MGTYTYQAEKTPRIISGKKIVATKCLGKPSYPRDSWWADKFSPQTEAALNRLNEHFEAVGTPDGFVFGKFCDGAPVLKAMPGIGSGIIDSATFERIGTLVKVGRSYKFVEVAK